MKALKEARRKLGWSQRNLAEQAGLAYKTLQLMESKNHDPRMQTVQNTATALGYPAGLIQHLLDRLWETPPDSVRMLSIRLLLENGRNWKIHFFNFVDKFRESEAKISLVNLPPDEAIPLPMKALFAATVESLCQEFDLAVPEWCQTVPGLSQPWFVSGMENLKALALVESPVYFRQRNIYVLGNFLSRG